MTIGENIKKARKKAGLTQVQLAQKLKVKQQTVAMFENDKTNIKMSTLDKFAKALEVPVFDLFDNNDSNISFEEKTHYADFLSDRELELYEAMLKAHLELYFLDFGFDYEVEISTWFDPQHYDGQIAKGLIIKNASKKMCFTFSEIDFLLEAHSFFTYKLDKLLSDNKDRSYE